MSNFDNNVDATHAELKQLRLWEGIVTFSSLVISIAAVTIGMFVMRKYEARDLFLICLAIYAADAFISNRVLHSIRKNKAELLIQLHEVLDTEDDENEAETDDATKGDDDDR